MSIPIKFSSRLAAFMLLFMLPTSIFSQITITADDILGLIGQEQTFEGDTTGSITVNVGSASAQAQTWDFRLQIANPLNFKVDYQIPTGSPLESNFPGSNLLQGTFFSGVPGFDEVKRCTYFEVTNSNFSSQRYLTPRSLRQDLRSSSFRRRCRWITIQ